MACARCHDHKFDPIPTQDYYSLAGVFARSQYNVTADRHARRGRSLSAGQERDRKPRTHASRRFLDEQAMRVAEGMTGEVARYMVAAWKLHDRRNRSQRMLRRSVAREEKLRPAILDQWTRYLFRRGSDHAASPGRWRKTLSSWTRTRISPRIACRWPR